MTQAEIFKAFMVATWGSGDGDNPDYHTFENAKEVASTMGAKPLGQTKNGETEWLFPDGSSAIIIDSYDDATIGTGVT